MERYDPSKNSWETVASMSRSTLGVAVLAGELYALGGYDGQSYLRSVEKYIPKVKEWQLVAPMSRTRSCFAAAVLDGMIYAIGGYGPAHMNRYVMGRSLCPPGYQKTPLGSLINPSVPTRGTALPT
uniref:Kelch-like protein 20 n=1 Tax=Malurus cyaneus samueli TaxID=2593467 RepID=A0A8C5TUD5_9PASS